MVEGVAGDSVLLVKTAELLSGGGVSTLFFNGTVTVATTPTTGQYVLYKVYALHVVGLEI